MGGLQGKRVLVVEDEAILALSIEDILDELGCAVVGPALSVKQAEMLAAEERLDAAVVDVNMGDGFTFSVAAQLRQRSIPFFFSTGYGAAGIPAEFADVPVLPKPYSEAALGAALRELLGLSDGAAPSPR